MNQRQILNFVNYCFSEGIGENRALKYLSTLKIVSKSINIDLDKAAEADIRAYVGSIVRSSLSDWTHGELCCPEIISLQDSSQIFTSELLIFATEPKKTVLEILVIHFLIIHFSSLITITPDSIKSVFTFAFKKKDSLSKIYLAKYPGVSKAESGLYVAYSKKAFLISSFISSSFAMDYLECKK